MTWLKLISSRGNFQLYCQAFGISVVQAFPTEDGDKSIEATDFDTTILVPRLPRSNPLSNRGLGGVVLR